MVSPKAKNHIHFFFLLCVTMLTVMMVQEQAVWDPYVDL